MTAGASTSLLAARVPVLFWALSYVGALLWSLETLIAPQFAYYGYEARDWQVVDAVVALLATIFVVAPLGRNGNRPSDLAHLFLVVTVAIPVIWVPMVYGPLSSDQVQNLCLAVGFSFTCIALCLTGDRSRLTVLVVSSRAFWQLIIFFALLAVVATVRSGVVPDLSRLSDVYDQRAQFRANVGFLGSYLVGWLAGGTIPLILALGIHRRNVKLVAFSLGSVLLLYSLTGYRSYIIGLALVGGVYVMTRRGRVVSWHWFSLLVLLIVTLGSIDHLRSGFALTSLLVRRAITTAGMNTAYYIDLFSGGPKYQLRHSILAFMGEPPSEQNPAGLVGSTYYLQSTSANANFLADGFANFGWIGVLGASILVGLLLRAYDKAAAGLPLAVTGPALVFVLLTLANTAVLTVVLTHGAAVLIGWVSLLPAAAAVSKRRERRPLSSESRLPGQQPAASTPATRSAESD